MSENKENSIRKIKDNDSKKILITGATGHVGLSLIKLLLDRSLSFRIFVRDPYKVKGLDARVERIVGNLDKPDTIARAVEGIDNIFLLTSNTQQDENVIRAALEAGCQKIVKLSTQEAGWTPIKGHGFWHHDREELIRASGLKWTFLRPTMFMTTALYWTHTIKNEGKVIFPGGNAKLAPIHPMDVASVAIEALTKEEHDEKGYELTGPELLSIKDLTSILSRVLHKSLIYVEQSESDFISDMLKMNLPKYAAEGLAETFKFVKAGEFEYCNDVVQQITGRTPLTFEHWCQENIKFFQ